MRIERERGRERGVMSSGTVFGVRLATAVLNEATTTVQQFFTGTRNGGCVGGNAAEELEGEKEVKEEEESGNDDDADVRRGGGGGYGRDEGDEEQRVLKVLEEDVDENDDKTTGDTGGNKGQKERMHGAPMVVTRDKRKSRRGLGGGGGGATESGDIMEYRTGGSPPRKYGVSLTGASGGVTELSLSGTHVTASNQSRRRKDALRKLFSDDAAGNSPAGSSKAIALTDAHTSAHASRSITASSLVARRDDGAGAGAGAGASFGAGSVSTASAVGGSGGDRIEPDELLVYEFSCALLKKKRMLLVHGRLYVFEKHLLFYSSLFGYRTRLCLSLKDTTVIARYPKPLPAGAIEVTTLSGKTYTFASILFVDSVLQFVQGAWCHASNYAKLHLGDDYTHVKELYSQLRRQNELSGGGGGGVGSGSDNERAVVSDGGVAGEGADAKKKKKQQSRQRRREERQHFYIEDAPNAEGRRSSAETSDSESASQRRSKTMPYNFKHTRSRSLDIRGSSPRLEDGAGSKATQLPVPSSASEDAGARKSLPPTERARRSGSTLNTNGHRGAGANDEVDSSGTLVHSARSAGTALHDSDPFASPDALVTRRSSDGAQPRFQRLNAFRLSDDVDVGRVSETHVEGSWPADLNDEDAQAAVPDKDALATSKDRDIGTPSRSRVSFAADVRGKNGDHEEDDSDVDVDLSAPLSQTGEDNKGDERNAGDARSETEDRDTHGNTAVADFDIGEGDEEMDAFVPTETLVGVSIRDVFDSCFADTAGGSEFTTTWRVSRGDLEIELGAWMPKGRDDGDSGGGDENGVSCGTRPDGLPVWQRSNSFRSPTGASWGPKYARVSEIQTYVLATLARGGGDFHETQSDKDAAEPSPLRTAALKVRTKQAMGGIPFGDTFEILSSMNFVEYKRGNGVYVEVAHLLHVNFKKRTMWSSTIERSVREQLVGAHQTFMKAMRVCVGAEEEEDEEDEARGSGNETDNESEIDGWSARASLREEISHLPSDIASAIKSMLKLDSFREMKYSARDALHGESVDGRRNAETRLLLVMQAFPRMMERIAVAAMHAATAMLRAARMTGDSMRPSLQSPFATMLLYVLTIFLIVSNYSLKRKLLALEEQMSTSL